MSFFGKFKPGSTPSAAVQAPAKKDPNAPVPTALEKLLAQDLNSPVRPDGSDKFFGFENYGSTCYCNSIVTALYYSEAFRENVINFPSKAFLESISDEIANTATSNGAVTGHKNTSSTPYPNAVSPARKVAQPTSPGPNVAIKPEESKDSPEYKKRMAIQNGPVLGMTSGNAEQYGMTESLFTSLKDIFEAVINNKSRVGVVSPHKFLDILRRENEVFRSAMHQDAHEFLNLLLNQVVDNVETFSSQHPAPLKQLHANGGAPENALSKVTTNGINGTNVPANGIDTTWVHDLFEGTLTSETRCLTCENTSQRDEAFLDLSVDLSAHSSVTSCLRKFSEEEMLCERNKFHCDNCGGLQEAEKRMKIKRLPRILALHLKRFKYTEDLQRLQKLFHRVVYPFYLRLFNTTDDAEDSDRLYELYAVVVHIGGGPYHGHYVSIIKTQDRGWLLFDDELVEPVDKNYVMNFFGGEPQPGVQDAKQLACAYVLFYQETTMEAMLKEQEAEERQQNKARTSDAGTAAPEGPLSPTQLYHTQTVTDPPHEYLDHMKPLAHAATAPVSPPSNMRQTSDYIPPMPNINPVLPPKSKKEIKAEEKERKAAQKAEEKAQIEARKESANKRMEAWRKQEAEMAQIMEMSKTSAAEEAKKRGEEVPPPAAAKTGGLARFARHGSMSLRSKPKLFGGGKDKDKDTSGGLPPLPQGSDERPNAPLLPSNGPEAPITPAEEKAKKNRFSLGRKKSTIY